MGLLGEHGFDEQRCRTLLGRSQVGRVALSVGAVPVVVPVRYALLAGELYLAVSAEDVANAMDGSVIALHADGYDEHSARHWSALAIGVARRVTTMSEDTTWATVFAPEDTRPHLEPGPAPDPFEGAATTLSTERYIVQLQDEMLSGGWLHL